MSLVFMSVLCTEITVYFLKLALQQFRVFLMLIPYNPITSGGESKSLNTLINMLYKTVFGQNFMLAHISIYG